jgi:RNA polymerase sigma-70 factor (ECF subfamily)
MSDSTTVVQAWIDCLRAGDAAARDELLASSCDRLNRLTRKMLKDYPGVRRWEETGDVLQNALLRLCRALREVTPPTARDYFRLAALQIRRELLDLARHYYGPHGAGAHHASHAPAGDSGDGRPPAHDPADQTHDPGRLAIWCEFHAAVQDLPEKERDVFELVWYQGLTQDEAARVLEVSEPTVQRRWTSARLRLHEQFAGRMPGL